MSSDEKMVMYLILTALIIGFIIGYFLTTWIKF